MNPKGQAALVSGGASGIGAAVVRRLVREGARCSILDIDERRGLALAKELGENVMFRPVDITDESSVVEALDAAEARWGLSRINVNCAGVTFAHRTVSEQGPFPLEAFSRVIRINLIGTFNVLRLAALRMANAERLNDDGDRGVIVNLSSIAANDGQIGQAAYSASKAGIEGMTLPIARDLGVMGIRIMTVAPGTVATPMFFGGADEAPPEWESYVTSFLSQAAHPRRLAEPDEVARLVAHCIENDYLNAETIRIDGGMRMHARVKPEE